MVVGRSTDTFVWCTLAFPTASAPTISSMATSTISTAATAIITGQSRSPERRHHLGATHYGRAEVTVTATSRNRSKTPAVSAAGRGSTRCCCAVRDAQSSS
jgi:hypothetical protein